MPDPAYPAPLPVDSDTPSAPRPGQTSVRLLAPLGGHQIGDTAFVDADLMDAYLAAGYIERLGQ